MEKTPESVTFSGRLTAGSYTLRGDVSSQFVTGSLLALPLLPEDSTLRVLPPVESRPYIDITLDIMALLRCHRDGAGTKFLLSSPAGSGTGAACAAVEGDWSNAAFLLALGGGVRVSGLRPDSLQGDRVCREMLRRLEHPGAVLDLVRLPRSGAGAVCRCGPALRGRVHRHTPPAHQGERPRGGHGAGACQIRRAGDSGGGPRDGAAAPAPRAQ